MTEREAWLSLGSNVGNREEMLAEAIQRLGRVPDVTITNFSSLYDTAPWGDEEQARFLNAVLQVRTSLTPHALLDAAKAIETDLGRTPSRRWGPRAIDIDIVHMAGVALRDDRLTLPHPHWRERAFVLAPLVEIAPELVIDRFAVTAALAACDASGVRRVGVVVSQDAVSFAIIRRSGVRRTDRMAGHVLDLPEHELLPMLREAIDRRAFSSAFIHDLRVALDRAERTPPDDQAEDELIEMANLDERDTHIPGTIFVSTALGSHGPRIKWYPGTPGRREPCLIMSIDSEPVVRDDFLPPSVSRPVVPLLREWVRTNQAALLDFWQQGETWDRRRVAAFLDGLVPVSR